MEDQAEVAVEEKAGAEVELKERPWSSCPSSPRPSFCVGLLSPVGGQLISLSLYLNLNLPQGCGERLLHFGNTTKRTRKFKDSPIGVRGWGQGPETKNQERRTRDEEPGESDERGVMNDERPRAWNQEPGTMNE